jgi:8-oxo-dGTP pyrophosphatase MutT (NUDIX family)
VTGGSSAAGLSPARLRARIEAVLGGRRRRIIDAGDRMAAAVLVLFLFRGGEPHLVFVKKTETVPHHKGQFSFPGGTVAVADTSPVETALRESREEIGLDPALVDVLGLFDDTPTNVSNFVITPVVGMARGAPFLRADGREIERVVEIPLARLLDPGAYREEWWERDGRRQPVVFFTVGADVVWGATGRILRDFLRTVFPEVALGQGVS